MKTVLDKTVVLIFVFVGNSDMQMLTGDGFLLVTDSPRSQL